MLPLYVNFFSERKNKLFRPEKTLLAIQRSPLNTCWGRLKRRLGEIFHSGYGTVELHLRRSQMLSMLRYHSIATIKFVAAPFLCGSVFLCDACSSRQHVLFSAGLVIFWIAAFTRSIRLPIFDTPAYLRYTHLSFDTNAYLHFIHRSSRFAHYSSRYSLQL